MRSRRLDLSRLMDAYEDTEFMPEEEVQVNLDHIKKNVVEL